jgi:HEAT repeat protein
MMELIKEHPQPGVIDTLGKFKIEEAIPYFIKALEDSISHRSAKEALRKAGIKVMNSLIETAILPLPFQTQDPSSSKQRQTSALELLSELPVDNKI